MFSGQTHKDNKHEAFYYESKHILFIFISCIYTQFRLVSRAGDKNRSYTVYKKTYIAIKL